MLEGRRFQIKTLTNTNAKTPYKYKRYKASEITKAIITDLINLHRLEKKKQGSGDKARKRNNFRRLESHKIGKGKYSKSFLNISMGFDIETTTLQEEKQAFMYIWQMSINGNVIIGRRWEEFIKLLDLIYDTIEPTTQQRVIIWVHNLGYEFSFMRQWLNIQDAGETFFKEQRSPLYVTHKGFFVFQDSYSMTNSKLERLAKDFTNTLKCVSDLDYSVIRTYKTKLSDQELSYCDNDVLILSEWADYYYDTYIRDNKRPLTITGVLLSECAETMKVWQKDHKINDWLAMLEMEKPKSYQEYVLIMNYLYRGGYVHGNELFSGITITGRNMKAFDFTSSYPAVMLLCYYPSKWTKVIDPTQEQFEKMSEKYCCYAIFEFEDLEAISTQTIESSHKCLELERPVLDNGRIRSAKRVKVMLTELDYANYKDFYNWSSVKITACHYSKRVPIYEYLLQPMLHYYVQKDILKKAGKPYALEKSKVNTFYGLCCKRLNEDITQYANGEWVTSPAKSYEEQKHNTILSPFTGIYISAHARRNILKCTKQLQEAGKEVAYIDTDSIKVLDFDDTAKEIIEAYNADIDRRLHIASIRYNVPYENIYDLGKWDEEYSEGITRFKQLGAKRYLVSYMKDGKEKHAQTVAGLKKGILFDLYDADTAYEKFSDNMIIENTRLTSYYNDEPMKVTVQGVEQFEYSNCALVKSNFTMSIDEHWQALYSEYQYLQSIKGVEKRI